MAMTTTHNKEPVFDISKPNNTAPSATSRPVITTHNPILKDPMMKDSSEPNRTDDPKPLTVSREKVIAPITEQTVTSEAEDAKSTTASEDEAAEATKKESEAAVVDAVAEQAGKKKKNESTKEDMARKAELEKMIEDKKYFVPIGQVNRRRNKRWFWATFILLLLSAVAVYAAVDANILDLGIKLPYELIP